MKLVGGQRRGSVVINILLEGHPQFYVVTMVRLRATNLVWKIIRKLANRKNTKATPSAYTPLCTSLRILMLLRLITVFVEKYMCKSKGEKVLLDLHLR